MITVAPQKSVLAQADWQKHALCSSQDPGSSGRVFWNVCGRDSAYNAVIVIK